MNDWLRILWYGSLVFMISIVFVDYIGMKDGWESYFYAFTLLLFALISGFEILRIRFKYEGKGLEE